VIEVLEIHLVGLRHLPHFLIECQLSDQSPRRRVPGGKTFLRGDCRERAARVERRSERGQRSGKELAARCRHGFVLQGVCSRAGVRCQPLYKSESPPGPPYAWSQL